MTTATRITATVVAGFIGIVSGASTVFAADTVNLKFHSPFGEAGINQGVRWWMDEVEERTNGQVEFTRIMGGTLGKLGGQPSGVKAGSFDVGQVSAVYNPGLYPRASVVMLPFLSDDVSVHNSVVHELMQTETFESEFATLNQKFMFNGTWITMEMLSYEPLDTIDDLKATKVRAHGGAAMAMEAAGITTYAIPWGELPAAAERRVVEAATMGAPTDAHDFGFGDIFEYWYQGMPFFYMPMTVVINQDSWDKIPADLQTIITDVNAEMPAKILEMTIDRESLNAENLIDKLGVKVHEFKEKDQLKAAGLSTWATWIEDRTGEGINGQGVIDAYMALTQKHSN